MFDGENWSARSSPYRAFDETAERTSGTEEAQVRIAPVILASVV